MEQRFIRKQTMIPKALPLAGMLLALLSAGCAEGFEPFNEVEKFRILSLQSDPPELREGETATLTPLIHAVDGPPLAYSWSWCPVAASPQEGGGCVVDEAMLRQAAEALLAEQMGEEGADLLDGVDIDFSLGTDETASFVYPLPRALLSQICAALFAEKIPSFTATPACESKFDIVVRLQVTQGDRTIAAVKRLPLIIDEGLAENRNPEVIGVTLTDARGRTVSDRLRPGAWYNLTAKIPESAVDRYAPPGSNGAPRDERLFMTWYVTGGSTDAVRTTYVEDDVPMSVLRTNRWQAPGPTEVTGDLVMLYLVLQDERGGVGWLQRSFEIEEAE